MSSGSSDIKESKAPAPDKSTVEVPSIGDSDGKVPIAIQPLSVSDERTWAVLAHLSILLNLITGFLGIVAALVIYLVFKDRSRYVAFQSMQAVVFQLIWWLGGGVLVGIVWTITGILTAVCIGLCLFPVAILISLIPVAALVYGVIGAVQCNQGLGFNYWLIGDWVKGMQKD